MDAVTPSSTDDELDLDVRFVESDLEFAGGDTDDCTKQCTDDNCDHTVGCE
ncbi:MAG: hypothetical protein ACRDRX_11395 [Pseudonocardiaceae bacterium]